MQAALVVAMDIQVSYLSLMADVEDHLVMIMTENLSQADGPASQVVALVVVIGVVPALMVMLVVANGVDVVLAVGVAKWQMGALMETIMVLVMEVGVAAVGIRVEATALAVMMDGKTFHMPRSRIRLEEKLFLEDGEVVVVVLQVVVKVVGAAGMLLVVAIGVAGMEVGPVVVVNMTVAVGMGKVLDAEEDVGVVVAIGAAVVEVGVLAAVSMVVVVVVVDGEGDMDLTHAVVVG